MSEFLLEWKIKWQLQSVFLYGDTTIDELETVQDSSELELQKNNSDCHVIQNLTAKAVKNDSSHLV